MSNIGLMPHFSEKEFLKLDVYLILAYVFDISGLGSVVW